MNRDFGYIRSHINKTTRTIREAEKLFGGASEEAEGLKRVLEILHATLADAEELRRAILKERAKEATEIWAIQKARAKEATEIWGIQKAPAKEAIKTLIKYPGSAKERLLWRPLCTGRLTYDLDDLKDLVERHLRDSSPGNVYCFFEADELMGIEAGKGGLISALLGGPSTRMVVSLVGSGGTGKTTLASVVYRNEDVQRHFDCCAWIDMSQVYNFESLLQTLAKLMVPVGEDDLCSERDIIVFHKYLPKKRYVVVFDNVWQNDFLSFMNEIFAENNNGSRIIITTRNNAIAASCDVVRQQQPLSEESACQLFSKSALWSTIQGLSRLEKDAMSRKIVGVCHCLPLLVWAAGDICRTRPGVVLSEWQMMLDHFTNEIKDNPYPIEEVSRTFYHNYDNMAWHLRLCLLYFSMFPKDSLIPDGKLIKLWIAEGFVQEETGKNSEQVAETYLKELIDRNLVQVSYVDYYGTERMCRVHSFIHFIISAKARRLRICRVLAKETDKLSVDSQIPRLSIHGEAISSLGKHINGDVSFVRSVQLFNLSETTTQKSLVEDISKRFTRLELLDFENAPIDSLPNELGKLILLKYLSLRNTKVKKLPKSLGKLLNLQTLDVRNTLVHELPIQIQKLRKLRHVLASSARDENASLDSIHGVRVREGIGCLESLQTLMTIEALASSLNVIQELERLTQLRWLSISKLTEEIMNTLRSIIEKMKHLESLSLYSTSDCDMFRLESISTPPPLQRLILKGRLKKLPDWILTLENLSTLGLSYSRLAFDPLQALQRLPNLKFLWLHRAYDGERLHFEKISFQKLKQLVLTELRDLRAIKIDKGALPLLEELRIGPAQNDLSIDIQNLRNLQVLECYDMPDKFVLRLQPEGGSDYWKVKHVSNVIFRFRVRGNHYVSFKLGEVGLLNHVKGLSRTTSGVELYCRQLSFLCNDDEEIARASNAEWSDQYSFFTDDVEY